MKNGHKQASNKRYEEARRIKQRGEDGKGEEEGRAGGRVDSELHQIGQACFWSNRIDSRSPDWRCGGVSVRW